MKDSVWEEQYKRFGVNAQRLYPNEELLRFFGANYFKLSFRKRRKIKVLELGCGSGANLWMIAKEKFDAYGIDNSATGLKLCSKMLKKWGCKAKIKLANMLVLPYPANYFDVVVDVVSLQHLPFSKHEMVLKEVNRVLKHGGMFFSYHFGKKGFLFKHGGGKLLEKFTLDKINNPEAPFFGTRVTCFPSERSFESVLHKTGFVNINIESVLKTYENRKIIIQYLVVQAKKG